MAEKSQAVSSQDAAKIGQEAHRQRLEAMKERLAEMKIVLRPDDLERYLEVLESAPDLRQRARIIIGRCYK